MAMRHPRLIVLSGALSALDHDGVIDRDGGSGTDVNQSESCEHAAFVLYTFLVPIVLHRVAVKAGEFNARRSGRSGGENRRGESAEREDEADFESSVYAHLLGRSCWRF